MKLKDTIRKVLKESLENELISFMDNYGIHDAARMTGGLENLCKILKKHINVKELKIRYIKEYVYKNYDGWLNLNDSDKAIDFRKISDSEEEAIEYLGIDAAIVVVYRKDYYKDWEVYEEYDVSYFDLPIEIINHIINLIQEKKI